MQIEAGTRSGSLFYDGELSIRREHDASPLPGALLDDRHSSESRPEPIYKVSSSGGTGLTGVEARIEALQDKYDISASDKGLSRARDVLDDLQAGG